MTEDGSNPVGSNLAGSLLPWYRAHRRDLPWRRHPDPYAVWVSEVMLQQTQVATVIPYFEMWMARFPTVADLAAAEESEVLHAWQGLGYYSRARNLLRGARAVARQHEGRVPDRIEDLLALPGVGRYTAGAIASIAFNQPTPIVDGNVTRVLCRVFALEGDPARSPLRTGLWDLARSLIPAGEAGDFNQALMEVGATVCSPTRPACADCPLNACCAARRAGEPEAYPQSAPRPRATPVHMVAGVVWRAGRVLLAQRADDDARWAGMWQFPNVEVGPEETAAEAVRRAVSETVGVRVDPGDRAAVIRHAVTRYRMTLEAYHCPGSAGEPRALRCQAWSWVRPTDFGDYALPAAHRNIARRLQQEERQLELGFGA
jgi:A/G-specific adenine glycosylase